MTAIEIRPAGNIGNQMLQLILAETIASRASVTTISGYDIPIWDLKNQGASIEKAPAINVKGHYISGDFLVSMINKFSVRIKIVGFFFDYEFFKHELTRIRKLFDASALDISGYGDDTLLINVRGNEILSPLHSDYGPLNLSFYEHLIVQSGLKPVFMGQIGDDYYSTLLKERFPYAEFISSRGALNDFEMIRRSRNIVLSVSTFSWLAAWFSEAKTIHFPVTGFFNPIQRPEINLIPIEDDRYRFYHFPVRKWVASKSQIDDLLACQTFKELNSHELKLILEKARSRVVFKRFSKNASLLIKGICLAIRQRIAYLLR